MPHSLPLGLPREEPLLLQPEGSPDPRIPWNVNDFSKLISNSSHLFEILTLLFWRTLTSTGFDKTETCFQNSEHTGLAGTCYKESSAQ